MPKSRGFTLIELLMVIAVIGVLATIIIVAVAGARQKARDAVRLADVRALAHALDLYYGIAGHYPVALATTTQCAHAGDWISDNGDYSWSAPYITGQPRDPAERCIPPQQVFTYQSDGTSYNVGIKLESSIDSGTGEGQQVAFDGSSFKNSQTQFRVTFSSTAGSMTNQSPIPVTVTFSVPVASFSESNISVDNGIISSFLQALQNVFSFLVTPISNGTVGVALPQNTILSQGGAGNEEAGFSTNYDTQRAHLSLSPDPLEDPVTGPFSVSVNSTVPLVDFGPGGVSVTNGTVSGFAEAAPNNGTNFTFTVTPTASGAISVVIPDGAAHTEAGNASVESNTLYTSY